MDLTIAGLSANLIDVGVLLIVRRLILWDENDMHWSCGQAGGNTNAPAAVADNVLS
jgi:hypothetical protein